MAVPIPDGARDLCGNGCGLVCVQCGGPYVRDVGCVNPDCTRSNPDAREAALRHRRVGSYLRDLADRSPR